MRVMGQALPRMLLGEQGWGNVDLDVLRGSSSHSGPGPLAD